MTAREQAIAYNKEMKTALETIMAALNKGQRKKLLQNTEVQALLKRYKIEIS